jgi:hypothetical protein
MQQLKNSSRDFAEDFVGILTVKRIVCFSVTGFLTRIPSSDGAFSVGGLQNQHVSDYETNMHAFHTTWWLNSNTPSFSGASLRIYFEFQEYAEANYCLGFKYHTTTLAQLFSFYGCF